MQSALNDFIRESHFSAHIRKMRPEYQARRETLVTLFQREFGDQIQLSGTETGLHVVMQLPPGVDAAFVETQSRRYGLAVRSLKNYYHDNSPKAPALILGFGNTEVPNILRAGKILIEILKANTL